MNIIAVEAKNRYNLGEGLSLAIVQKTRELLREC
jgi:hypothetical protein